jgi:thiol-disulfide isomerase/thioredoxin
MAAASAPAHDASDVVAAPAAACAEPDCLPAFRATTIDGAPVSTDDLRDKVVLVMFWASWCEPCIADGPTIDSVYARRKADGFAILALSRDEVDDATLRAFRAHYRLGYPIARSTPESFAAFGSPEDIPTFLIFGRDGRRRARLTGAMPAAVLEREIALALAPE